MGKPELTIKKTTTKKTYHWGTITPTETDTDRRRNRGNELTKTRGKGETKYTDTNNETRNR